MSSLVSGLKGVGYSVAGAACALMPASMWAASVPLTSADVEPPVDVSSVFVTIKQPVEDLMVKGIGFVIGIVVVGFLLALAYKFLRSR